MGHLDLGTRQIEHCQGDIFEISWGYLGDILGCSGMGMGMGHLDLGTRQIEHCQGDSDSFAALLDKTLPIIEKYS